MSTLEGNYANSASDRPLLRLLPLVANTATADMAAVERCSDGRYEKMLTFHSASATVRARLFHDMGRRPKGYLPTCVAKHSRAELSGAT